MKFTSLDQLAGYILNALAKFISNEHLSAELPESLEMIQLLASKLYSSEGEVIDVWFQKDDTSKYTYRIKMWYEEVMYEEVFRSSQIVADILSTGEISWIK